MTEKSEKERAPQPQTSGMTKEEKERLQKSYNEYVEEVTPKASLPNR